MIEVNYWFKIPLSEVKFTYTTSSGPGGQHVNKVSTKAVLRWNIATTSSLTDNRKDWLKEKLKNKLTKSNELIVTSDKFRDRTQNISDCKKKFKSMLAAACKVDKPRKETKITKSQKKKRLDNKKVASDKKQSRKKINY